MGSAARIRTADPLSTLVDNCVETQIRWHIRSLVRGSCPQGGEPTIVERRGPPAARIREGRR
ncbi:hypothetical protein RHCRD62_70134 [Rhodococcus sp. RD6.2]|nr:hypothetical protein RHCRD62_70134 [Rhodococcus sp. RD6.2]